jgi:hypothetical protein
MRSRVVDQINGILQERSPRLNLFAESLRKDVAPAAPDVAEIPLGFSAHDYAVFLLHIAAEIEHGLLVQYLFAAYSLGGPQVPEKHQPDVQKWQTTLFGIAKEEMGHFVTVQNVLKLLGGALNLERNDYPWDVPFSPFRFSLEPLSRRLLARYVYIESPEVWPEKDAALKKEITDIALEGGPSSSHRVGELYDRIVKVIRDKSLIPDSLFHEDTLAFQASWAEWGRGYRDGSKGAIAPDAETPDVLVLTAYSRQTAIDALTAVAEQGEAAGGDAKTIELSHFQRFLEIYRAFPGEKEWQPCRKIACNPRAVGNKDGDPDTTFIANDVSRRWAELLNLRYRMLLSYLTHSFRLSGEPGSGDIRARGAVLNRTFGEMYNLRAISGILVGLPCGGKDPELRAGPTFELPYTLTLPILERDVWRLHLDLLEASNALVASLRKEGSAAADAYLQSLAALDDTAAEAFQAILDGADTPVAHRHAGGRT